MNIQASKLELMKLILNINNDKLILSITDFIQKETVDFWDELSVSEKKEIKKGIEQLKNGNRVEFKEFMKEVS